MRMLILFFVVLFGNQAQSQEWIWEIREAERVGSVIKITFFMQPKFEDQEKSMSAEFVLNVDKKFLRDKVYPNISKKERRLKFIVGLIFEKDPRDWNIDSNIYPYRSAAYNEHKDPP